MARLETFAAQVTPVQLDLLRRLSRVSGVSMSAMVRDWIDRCAGLECLARVGIEAHDLMAMSAVELRELRRSALGRGGRAG